MQKATQMGLLIMLRKHDTNNDLFWGNISTFNKNTKEASWLDLILSYVKKSQEQLIF